MFLKGQQQQQQKKNTQTNHMKTKFFLIVHWYGSPKFGIRQ